MLTQARKRQLLPRIKQWGNEKNVKEQERRAILRALDSHRNIGDINIGRLGSKKFKKAKIERWRKADAEAGVSVGIGLYVEPSNISGKSGNFSEFIMLTPS